jgi:hypothetical protein
MFPKYWEEFIKANNIIGYDFEIDEESDLSELGGNLRIMTSEQSTNEATNVYPGTLAVKENYIPVAMCLEGSGDYYYINSKDGPSGPLYRIYHDSVEGDKINKDGIEKVLENYEKLLLYQRL